MVTLNIYLTFINLKPTNNKINSLSTIYFATPRVISSHRIFQNIVFIKVNVLELSINKSFCLVGKMFGRRIKRLPTRHNSFCLELFSKFYRGHKTISRNCIAFVGAWKTTTVKGGQGTPGSRSKSYRKAPLLITKLRIGTFFI